MIIYRSRYVKTLLVGLFIAVAISACDTVEGMRDLKDAQNSLQGTIKEEIGVDSLVSFTIKKGVLIDVSVSLDADDVVDRSVSELLRVVRSAVKSSFDNKPRAIYIQIAATAE